MYQFFGCDLLDLGVFFFGFLFWTFLFGCSTSGLARPIQTVPTHVSLFATFETFAFLSEGGSFVVGQGSLSTGMSRGKIHGIWVLCKTSLPLLFGRSLIGVSWIEIFSPSKIRLVGEIFAVLPDSAFYPVLQGLIMTGWFECEH